MRKSILKEYCSCSAQKNRSKKQQIFEKINETILKIGHLAKAIAHAKTIAFGKSSPCVKN